MFGSLGSAHFLYPQSVVTRWRGETWTSVRLPGGDIINSVTTENPSVELVELHQQNLAEALVPIRSLAYHLKVLSTHLPHLTAIAFLSIAAKLDHQEHQLAIVIASYPVKVLTSMLGRLVFRLFLTTLATR